MDRKKNIFQRKSIGFIIFVLIGNIIIAEDIIHSINEHKHNFEDVALEIWEFAELGYQEIKSSNRLAESLENQGFKIEKGVAGIPTAFIAEFNNGGPVIGILGEFDALPGLAQTNSPFKDCLLYTSPSPRD